MNEGLDIEYMKKLSITCCHSSHTYDCCVTIIKQMD